MQIIRNSSFVATALCLFLACGGEGVPSDEDGEPDGAEGGAGGAAPAACPEPTGAGTEHTEWLIEADETWSAADSPHYVRQNTSIRGATVTVEACAVVVLAEGVTLEIGDSVGEPSGLVALGQRSAAATRPVTFTSAAAGMYWKSLWVDATGTLDLTGAVLERGGSVAGANANGAIVTASNDELPVRQNLRVLDTRITDSSGVAVHLQRNSGFTSDSDGLEIDGAGAEGSSGDAPTLFPIVTAPGGISTIPAGKYTGNAVDAILVDGDQRYPQGITFHERGVPYRLQSDLQIEPLDEEPITLELEAGVRVEFSRGIDGSDARYRLSLGSSAATVDPSFFYPVRVIARGTADAPIVFTSAEDEPAAGDWVGIDWGGGPADGNVMDYVTIEYAGADSQTNGFGCGNGSTYAALFITDWLPEDEFIQRSTFADSAGGGIISGWDGTAAGPNLRGDNAFSAIDAGFCEVSQPKVDGQCPGDDAAPDCY